MHALAIGKALQSALAHHKAGRIVEAEALYRDILSADPDHADSLHLLGVLALQSGRHAVAAELIGQAIDVKSDVAAFHSNRGNAWKELGRRKDAGTSYKRALLLKPDDAEVWCNLGLALREDLHLLPAVACYRRAACLKPDFAEAQVSLGIALHAAAAERSGRLLRKAGKGVRAQYEALPFPSRDPEAEHHVLTVSVADTLSKVNQYCFGGKRDFSRGLRVLVAGSGTGDSVLWLAHQLRGTGAEIVALDFSHASLEIAKARAAIRGFIHIRWIEASLLDLPRLGLGLFDYISCLGVLHHLPDPEAGLAALESVLADDGGMAIMLYGRHGRAPIYAMQNLLRRLTAGIEEPEQRLAMAHHVLSTLPPTNMFRLMVGQDTIKRCYLEDDANLWDTLLHEQDRAYSASEMRAFMARAGLHVQSFATYQGTAATCALQYDLDFQLGVSEPRPSEMPLGEGEDLAEMLDGNLPLHTVYATRSPQAALAPTSTDAILSVMTDRARQIIRHMINSDESFPVLLNNGKILDYRPSAKGRAFLAAIDGQRSNAEIALSLGDAQILDAVATDLKIPAALHWVTARTVGGTAWPPLPSAGKLTLPSPHEEPQTIANVWL